MPSRDLKFPSRRRKLLVRSVWTMPSASQGEGGTGWLLSFMDGSRRSYIDILKRRHMGDPGGLSTGAPPAAQGVTPGSRDRGLLRAPRVQPAAPSAWVSASHE